MTPIGAAAIDPDDEEFSFEDELSQDPLSAEIEEAFTRTLATLDDESQRRGARRRRRRKERNDPA